MLGKGPSKEFLGAIIICLSVALMSVLITPPFEAAQDPNDRSPHDSVKSVNNNKDEMPSEYWTVLGRRLKITDTLLVVFSFTLWWATRNLVKGSAEASERQLRAYLSVEVGQYIRQSRKRHVRFEFRPVINNNGSTPATEVRVLSKIELSDPNIPAGFDYMLKPADLKPGSVTTIGPGQNRFHGSIFPRYLAFQDMREIYKGKKCFHVWGIVIYKDAFKIDRYTHFSYIIFVGNKKISPVWLSTHEHNDST
jgi:hypothetical protein